MRQSGRNNEGAKTLFRAAGNPPTLQDAIRLLVTELLRDLSMLPTDLESLKLRLNIVDFCAENIPYSGELRRQDKGLRIIYSTHLSDDRRRFTIAHEMGHALLEKIDKTLPRSGGEIEKLCDSIAAEILMPTDIFLERRGSALTIERLFDLKRAFRVSLLAVAFRCLELKHDCVFEVEKRSVKWGCGLVKKGPLRLIDGGLLLSVDEALQKERGDLEVYFLDQGKTYRGELEWSQMAAERTLFILRRSNNQTLCVTAPFEIYSENEEVSAPAGDPH